MANILLIEPDIILAATYRLALERHGHSVNCQSRAQSAIEAADKQRPDIVVVELQLARHNGVDFLYEFRSYNDWQPIPVVILSMVPPHEAGLGPSLWRQLNIAAYCYKPHTTLEDLLAVVHDVTSNPLPA